VYFEKSSRVGMHIAEILAEFIQEADCAVILLTADDKQPDGLDRARQNVVHEVGVFQGRFGFRRVAMLIQDGVEEFTNVTGIMPIRFKDHHIDHTFVGLRGWLKREGLIP